MAQVPNVPAPQVPESAAPTPFLDVRPPAEAFGANVVGEAANAIGAGATQASGAFLQHAIRFQTINAQQVTDAAAVKYNDALFQQQEQFRTANLGVDPKSGLSRAELAFPAFQAQLEQQRVAARAVVPLAMQQQFDQDTRRVQSTVSANLAGFAAQQRIEGMVKTNTALQEQYQELALAHYDDPKARDAYLAQGVAKIGQLGAQLGWSDEVAHEAVQKFVGGVNEAAIKQKLDGGDYPGAQKIFDATKDTMTVQQQGIIGGALRATAKQYEVQGMADAFLNGTHFPGVPNGAMSRADRNNNPLNLTVLPNGQWNGQVGTDGRFAVFSSPEAGRAAADKNLASYGREGVNTLAGVISRWAPPGENDTASYIASVAHATGLDPHAPINLADASTRARILNAMEPIERGHSGSAGPVSAGAPGLQMSYNSDPKEVFDRTMAGAEQFAEQHFGEDPVKREQFLRAVETRTKLQVEVLADHQQHILNTFGLAAATPDANGDLITDQGTLFSRVPGAAEMFAQLPATINGQGAIQKMLNENLFVSRSRETPEMAANANRLEFLRQQNPQAFLQENLLATPLAGPDRLSFINQQETMKKQSGVKTPDDRLEGWLASPQITSIVHSVWPDNATRETDPTYQTFMGSVLGEVSKAEAASGGKPLPLDQVNNIVRRLTTQQQVWTLPGGIGNFGPAGSTQAAPQAPPAKYLPLIDQRLQAAGIVPDPVNRARYYHMFQDRFK